MLNYYAGFLITMVKVKIKTTCAESKTQTKAMVSWFWHKTMRSSGLECEHMCLCTFETKSTENNEFWAKHFCEFSKYCYFFCRCCPGRWDVGRNASWNENENGSVGKRYCSQGGPDRTSFTVAKICSGDWQPFQVKGYDLSECLNVCVLLDFCCCSLFFPLWLRLISWLLFWHIVVNSIFKNNQHTTSFATCREIWNIQISVIDSIICNCKV